MAFNYPRPVAKKMRDKDGHPSEEKNLNMTTRARAPATTQDWPLLLLGAFFLLAECGFDRAADVGEEAFGAFRVGAVRG